MSTALVMPDVVNVSRQQVVYFSVPSCYICTLPPADASPSSTVLFPLRPSHSLPSTLMHTCQPLSLVVFALIYYEGA